MLCSAVDEIEEWVNEGLTPLRTKGGEELLDGLQPQLKDLRYKKPDAMNSLLDYLRSSVGITWCAVFRDLDWQIGSGMIESTAKQLVGIRLKRRGTHLSPHGASAVAALRAHYINNTLEEPCTLGERDRQRMRPSF